MQYPQGSLKKTDMKLLIIDYDIFLLYTIVAFVKTFRVRGQDYRLNLIDTAGQVLSKGFLYYYAMCVAGEA